MKYFEEKGFTLLEVLIATAIIAMAFGALFPVFSSSHSRAADLKHEQQAIEVAQTILNTAIADGSWSNVPIEGQLDGWDWEITAASGEGNPVTANGSSFAVQVSVSHASREDGPEAQLNHVFWVVPQ